MKYTYVYSSNFVYILQAIKFRSDLNQRLRIEPLQQVCGKDVVSGALRNSKCTQSLFFHRIYVEPDYDSFPKINI